MYRHTQAGYVTAAAAVGGGVALLFAIGARRKLPLPIYVAVGAVLLLAGVVFSSLTIEVDDGELRSHFGPGFWRKRVRLADVEGAELAPSTWWEGWGIRITPRGMLYNVSGTGAVEVRLRSGERFRLGSDEPEALLRAIRAGLGPPPG
jgi:hypothetical protein